MKLFKTLLVGFLLGASTLTVNAQGLGDILKGIGGGSNVGDMIGSVIEGVFTKTNLSLDDLVGEYKSEGPAVTFKSENFLQKAGGLAGAAKIESELKPYYEKYGLNNMSLKVDSDHNFTMVIKGISLKGNITKNDSEGTFDFNFNVMGLKIGKFTAYVEKSGKNLNLMFDASKLKDFISAVVKFTGNSMAKALGTILDSYDGACIGFKMVSTGATTGNSNVNSSDDSGTTTNSNSGSSSSPLDALKDILKSKK